MIKKDSSLSSSIDEGQSCHQRGKVEKMEFKNDTRFNLVLIFKLHNGTISTIPLAPNESEELHMREKAKTLSIHESSSQG